MKLEFCSLGCAMMISQVDLVKAIRLANHKLCTSVAPCRKDLLNVFLLCRFLISAACFLWLCWPVCCFCVCWQFTGDRVIAKRCWNHHVFGNGLLDLQGKLWSCKKSVVTGDGVAYFCLFIWAFGEKSGQGRCWVESADEEWMTLYKCSGMF